CGDLESLGLKYKYNHTLLITNTECASNSNSKTTAFSIVHDQAPYRLAYLLGQGLFGLGPEFETTNPNEKIYPNCVAEEEAFGSCLNGQNALSENSFMNYFKGYKQFEETQTITTGTFNLGFINNFLE